MPANGPSSFTTTLRSDTAVFRYAEDVLFASSVEGDRDEDIAAWVEAVQSVAGAGKPYVVWDAKLIGPIASADRTTLIHQIGPDLTALALVASLPISHRVVNLFHAVQQMPIPTALFESEAEAVEWIETIRSTNS